MPAVVRVYWRPLVLDDTMIASRSVKMVVAGGRGTPAAGKGIMASRAPLHGYNHNVRYRNRIYHVQTEDSGVDNPHIYTHLFHGGVILASGATPLGDIIDCGPRPRSPEDYFEECRYSLCIVMDAVSETSSLVTVRLEGNVTLHSRQYSYPLGIPLWYVSDELTCTSTGRLEHDLFACLRH